MIKEIVTDTDELSKECDYISPKKTGAWEHIITNLLDTAKSHRNNCAGLAANQISYKKRAIVVRINKSYVPMINPQFIVQYGGFKKEFESCLSLPGVQTKKRRYKKIKVMYFCPINMVQVPCLKLKGFEARTIQHEIDHLNGILI